MVIFLPLVVAFLLTMLFWIEDREIEQIRRDPNEPWNVRKANQEELISLQRRFYVQRMAETV